MSNKSHYRKALLCKVRLGCNTKVHKTKPQTIIYFITVQSNTKVLKLYKQPTVVLQLLQQFTTLCEPITQPSPPHTAQESNCINKYTQLRPASYDRLVNTMPIVRLVHSRCSSPLFSIIFRHSPNCQCFPQYIQHNKKQNVCNHKTHPNLYTRSAINGMKCKQANDVKCSQLRNKTELCNNVI